MFGYNCGVYTCRKDVGGAATCAWASPERRKGRRDR